MGANKGMLHMFCGKIAAGKSTLAAQLSGESGAVLISEDHLLSRLYPGEIAGIEDYRRCTARLRVAIQAHIVALPKEGVSVVLDFQANTPAARAWMRSLIDESGADHRLHYLDAGDAECKARLEVRNAAGTHDYQVSEADFELFTSFFVPPLPEEGFTVVVHRHG